MKPVILFGVVGVGRIVEKLVNPVLDFRVSAVLHHPVPDVFLAVVLEAGKSALLPHHLDQVGYLFYVILQETEPHEQQLLEEAVVLGVRPLHKIYVVLGKLEGSFLEVHIAR